MVSVHLFTLDHQIGEYIDIGCIIYYTLHGLRVFKVPASDPRSSVLSALRACVYVLIRASLISFTVMFRTQAGARVLRHRNIVQLKK